MNDNYGFLYDLGEVKYINVLVGGAHPMWKYGIRAWVKKVFLDSKSLILQRLVESFIISCESRHIKLYESL